MPQFSYKAGKASGQVFQGVVEANSEADAVSFLEDKGYKLVYLEKISKLFPVEAKKDFWPLPSETTSLISIIRGISVLVISQHCILKF